ncbi:hypothetical protein ASD21_13570 [Caulobacter sp. Root1455]|jgi:hypothetical protein|uniref:hypothetical protein n=1 Tax=unclassified Caulobacter TaxID=2648921 RepID=UPI0006FE517C|nr:MULTISPECIES: hypothetical protein [unclassified Caulobacter]KQY30129.1 hypothetical protein ASD38_12630 [Caulobacter sp. Root487D2Y]KQY92429.1 hypothetical protein ASD21_13570 [Caulobacter sp. Root1455]
MNVAFDTLGATKRLRDAGLEDRAAEAIVELVQSTTQLSEDNALATKSDVADLTRAIRTDIQGLRADLAITKTQILVELNDKLRSQSFALMGGVTAVVGLATAIIKLGS